MYNRRGGNVGKNMEKTEEWLNSWKFSRLRGKMVLQVVVFELGDDGDKWGLRCGLERKIERKIEIKTMVQGSGEYGVN